MQILNEPDQMPPDREDGGSDAQTRFRSWRGFLFVAIAVNALYLWGMMGQMQDPSTAVWAKVLTWLPFNLIASVLYFVFLVKLSKADEDAARAAGGADKAGTGGAFYAVLCLAMIAVNWSAFFAA
jgi:hypothetical protein